MATLVRDHTVKFYPEERVNIHEFNDLIANSFSTEDIACVQSKSDGCYEVTFASPEKAAATLEKIAVTLCGKMVYISGVDEVRTFVKVRGLPYEIPNADLNSALLQFGRVIATRRDRYPGRTFYNGDRTTVMILKEEMPRYWSVLGYEITLTYKKQGIYCSYCKQQGHSREQCPDLICRVCNGQGHFSYQCKERYCGVCKEHGHWARQCPHGFPNRDSQTSRSNLKRQSATEPSKDPRPRDTQEEKKPKVDDKKPNTRKDGKKDEKKDGKKPEAKRPEDKRPKTTSMFTSVIKDGCGFRDPRLARQSAVTTSNSYAALEVTNEHTMDFSSDCSPPQRSSSWADSS